MNTLNDIRERLMLLGAGAAMSGVINAVHLLGGDGAREVGASLAHVSSQLGDLHRELLALAEERTQQRDVLAKALRWLIPTDPKDCGVCERGHGPCPAHAALALVDGKEDRS